MEDSYKFNTDLDRICYRGGSSGGDLTPTQLIATSKDYEFFTVKRDPYFEELVTANEIVKEFIIAHNLIVYGGVAIDLALRLKGSKIYSDESLAVPDLDFFSTNSIAHSYDLAAELYNRGFPQTRSINGIHFTTRKIDIGDNHFVADISYVPPEIFPRLPFLIHDGMRVIHPDFQRVDLHSSLAFPYDNTPREVIFERWNKDIKRFNLLAEHYPITVDASVISAIKLPHREIPDGILHNNVMTGLLAYAAIVTALGDLAPEGILRADFGGTKRGATCDRLEFVSIKYDAWEITHLQDPYMNITQPLWHCVYKGAKCVVHDTRGRLVATSSLEIGGKKYRVTGLQYLLKYFIAKSFLDDDPVWRAAYVSTLRLTAIDHYLCKLSIETYGGDNVTIIEKLGKNQIDSIVDGAPLFEKPPTWRPASGKMKPTFSILGIDEFNITGEINPVGDIATAATASAETTDAALPTN